MPVRSPARAKAALDAQLAEIAWLRGTGPNPFEYGLWHERTEELILDVFGQDSDELLRFQDAAGTRGRLPGVRGQAENMTLNIHGHWGILARLERAELVLRGITAALA